jgi:putative tryptophan/tyrosine transport system substrate-binding protein
MGSRTSPKRHDILARVVAASSGQLATNIKRRQFIAALGGIAVAWPLATRAQQSAPPMIGYLNSTSASGWAAQLAAFLRGLRSTGYDENKNVVIEYRWAEDRNDTLPALAAELARKQINVLVANGPAAAAAQAATTTIPIVFTTGADPVAAGLVPSLNRPGGNLTGVTTLNIAMGAKRLELLHELVPRATTVAMLVNPTDRTAESSSKDAQAAAAVLGLQLHILHASVEEDFNNVFESLAQLHAGALVIGADAFLISQSKQLGVLAIRHAVPTVSSYHDFAAAGGLMTYGDSLSEVYSQAGIYTGRILKGEKPADLPVQQATKEELIINLKTAKLLGLSVPLPLLGRADQVIE